MTEDFSDLGQAALEIQEGLVLSANDAALRLLPGLAVGHRPPEALLRALEGEKSAGEVELAGRPLIFMRIKGRDRQLVCLLDRDCPYTPDQLEAALREQRRELGSLLGQIEQVCRKAKGELREGPTLEQLNQSFYRLLRLNRNLELLRCPQEELAELVELRPVDLDLLCRDLTAQAAPLLRKAGFTLTYEGPGGSLRHSVDPLLLQRLLLGLISNAAKTGGPATLRLRNTQDGAQIDLICDPQARGEGLAALGARESGELRHGAHLGLDAARKLAKLPQGSLLAREEQGGALSFTLLLPTRQDIDSWESWDLQLQSPVLEDLGGLSPFLLELSDVLPGELFAPDID